VTFLDILIFLTLLIIALLAIKTADALRTYRANRKSEAAALTKRDRDALVSAQAQILREALFMLGRKK
jgi:hypothetical protein